MDGWNLCEKLFLVPIHTHIHSRWYFISFLCSFTHTKLSMMRCDGRLFLRPLEWILLQVKEEKKKKEEKQNYSDAVICTTNPLCHRSRLCIVLDVVVVVVVNFFCFTYFLWLYSVSLSLSQVSQAFNVHFTKRLFCYCCWLLLLLLLFTRCYFRFVMNVISFFIRICVCVFSSFLSFSYDTNFSSERGRNKRLFCAYV